MLYYILPLNDLWSIYTYEYIYLCLLLFSTQNGYQIAFAQKQFWFFCVLLKNFKICFLISKREAKSHYQAFCTFFAFRVSSLMQTLLLQVTKMNSCITHFSFNKKPPHPYLILRAKIFKNNYYLPYENISNISLQCTFIATTKSVIYFSPVKIEPSCNWYFNWALPCWRINYFAALLPAGNYMFKVNNRNNRTRCGTCSKLTIKIPEQ